VRGGRDREWRRGRDKVGKEWRERRDKRQENRHEKKRRERRDVARGAMSLKRVQSKGRLTEAALSSC
jgi:hypothetical protein